MILQFEVPGPARGQGRPRFSRRGGYVRTYTDPKDTAYARAVQVEALAAKPRGWEPLTGPVRLTITVYQKVSKRSAKGASYSVTRPDLDNVLKAILDALSGIAFHDDRQVAVIEAEKRLSDRPRVYVTVQGIG